MYTNIRLIFMIRKKTCLVKVNMNASIKKNATRERKATFTIICLISLYNL